MFLADEVAFKRLILGSHTMMKKREQVRTLESEQRYGENLPELVLELHPDTGRILGAGDWQQVQVEQAAEKVLDALGDAELTEPDLRGVVGGNQSLTA